MSLGYIVDEIVKKYENTQIDNDVIIDVKILDDNTTFFESEIKNHCRFVLKKETLDFSEDIKGEPDVKPDIVVYGKEDVIVRILEGGLDPLQAFLTGNLRMEGNTDLAINVAKLAS